MKLFLRLFDHFHRCMSERRSEQLGVVDDRQRGHFNDIMSDMQGASTSALPLASSSTLSNDSRDAHLASFARGVFAIIDAWPAFRIARDERLFYSDAGETRIHLAEELVDAFTSSTSMPTSSELSDFLVRFMDGESGLSLEDASEIAIARDLINLWSTPHGAERDAVLQRLEGYSKQRQVVSYKRVDKEGNALPDGEESDRSDELGDSADDEDEEEGAMDVDEAPTRSKAEPVVDDDGFTLVQRARKR